MHINQLNILLADDDTDNCIFFKQALDELLLPVTFTAVHDGEQLMQQLLIEIHKMPHVLFLDLNMPRKNGFECLSEIKHNEKLKQLPVIMFSTSFEQGVVDQLYLNGAQYFIRKPSDFGQFKKIIHQTIAQIATVLPADKTANIVQPEKENFVFKIEN